MHGLNGPASQSMDLVVILPISRYGYVYARRVEVAASRTGVSVDRQQWQVIVLIVRERFLDCSRWAINPECIYLFN